MKKVLDGVVRFAISGLDAGERPAGLGDSGAVEQTVCQGTADALVKENEQQRDLHTLVGKSVSIAFAIPLEKSMGLHLAEIIAVLVERVVLGSNDETAEDG